MLFLFENSLFILFKKENTSIRRIIVLIQVFVDTLNSSCLRKGMKNDDDPS